MKKNIVVIGGGFAGISAIKELLKHIKEVDMVITLIDKNDYHLFTPSLYEIATNEESQKNVAIPFNEIFGDKITFIKAIVTKIDIKDNFAVTKNQKFPYDYLLLCVGSISAYHNIPGLKEHSFPLKSISNAIAIKEKIKLLCSGRENANKINIVIGGGGFSGTELAAELLTYKNKLIEEYHLSKNFIDITIIQGSGRLLKELDLHVSKIAQRRLSVASVHFAFGGHIQEVTDKEIITDKRISYPYDLLIWTGGVEANKLAVDSGFTVNKKGQIIVNSFLRVSQNIFAAGDIAGFIDINTQNPVPNVAQVAEDQGKIIGKNIYCILTHKNLYSYKYRHFGYIVPLKGKFAAAELIGNIHFDGFIGWILQQIVFLRYLFTIMPIRKALKRWNIFEKELRQ